MPIEFFFSSEGLELELFLRDLPFQSLHALDILSIRRGFGGALAGIRRVLVGIWHLIVAYTPNIDAGLDPDDDVLHRGPCAKVVEPHLLD